MSPGMCSMTKEAAGFPRVSGDEPVPQQPTVGQLSFSPRERG